MNVAGKILLSIFYFACYIISLLIVQMILIICSVLLMFPVINIELIRNKFLNSIGSVGEMKVSKYYKKRWKDLWRKK